MGCVWEWFRDVSGWVWDHLGKNVGWGRKIQFSKNGREYVFLSRAIRKPKKTIPGQTYRNFGKHDFVVFYRIFLYRGRRHGRSPLNILIAWCTAPWNAFCSIARNFVAGSRPQLRSGSAVSQNREAKRPSAPGLVRPPPSMPKSEEDGVEKT